MPNIAITALPVATSAGITDVLPIVQGGITKQVTNALLFTNATLVTPTLTAPALGTVASGNISACTSTSQVLVTPVLGVATGTSLSTTGNQTITGTGKQGYATGSGGAVTQATSKATGVTLNKSNGQITMVNSALAGTTIVSFTLTNSVIEAGDIIVMNHISGGTLGAYAFNASTAAGSASINVSNLTTGSLSDAIVLLFAIIKVVSA
jgi:hypothetical protein